MRAPVVVSFPVSPFETNSSLLAFSPVFCGQEVLILEDTRRRHKGNIHAHFFLRVPSCVFVDDFLELRQSPVRLVAAKQRRVFPWLRMPRMPRMSSIGLLKRKIWANCRGKTDRDFIMVTWFVNRLLLRENTFVLPVVAIPSAIHTGSQDRK
ncbi:MAG: hypothetical protein ACKV2V_23615 [Blastocatellia bacterium]